MAANAQAILENTIDGYLAESTSIQGGYMVVSSLTDLQKDDGSYKPSVITGTMVRTTSDDKWYIFNANREPKQIFISSTIPVETYTVTAGDNIDSYGTPNVTKTLSSDGKNVDLEFNNLKGNGIEDISVQYYLTNSFTVPNDTVNWRDTIYKPTASLPYAWEKITITYSDKNTKVIKNMFSSLPKYISSITNYYAVSTTYTCPDLSSFISTKQQLTSTNKYLWEYVLYTFTDSTTITTDAKCIGVYGDKGDKGDTGDPGCSFSLSGTVLTITWN